MSALEPFVDYPVVVLDDTPIIPGLIAAAGDRASKRFVEFFAAQIENRNTREAYGRAVRFFCAWCERHGLTELSAIEPVHVAAYLRQLGQAMAVASVKQHRAALGRLFDWLVVGQVMPSNPVMSVRGPKHVVKKGKTPVLIAEEARHLITTIPADTSSGRRDRALIGLMTYSFARIGAALAMNEGDLFEQRSRLHVRLREKGGKHHEMPCHHTLEAYLRDYVEAAAIGNDKKVPLFRTIDRQSKQLSDRRLDRVSAWLMVRRRARQAGITTPVGNHTFRGTGITAYMKNGGQLEHAAEMAAHASTRTTQLYNRSGDAITLDEVERIPI